MRHDDTPVLTARYLIHPMLLPFPIALWMFSLVSDGLYLFDVGGPVWKDIALYSMVAGLGGAMAAVVPAVFDYRAIPSTERGAAVRGHMLLNGVIVLLYGANAVVRLDTGPEAMAPVVTSVAGVVLLAVSVRWSGRVYASWPAGESEGITRWPRAA